MACVQDISSSSRLDGDTKEVFVEVDDEITPDEIIAGLKKAKYLLLSSPLLTEEERNIKDLNKYKEKIQEYIEDERAVQAVRGYFFKLFNVVEPSNKFDYLEPANLAAKLYKENADFRGFLTAPYCVTEIDGEFIEGSCVSASVENNNLMAYSLPPEMTAGFISTQAFLYRYAGAKNFRRISKVFEFALCSSAPASGEPEGWKENAQEITLHPFYWSSINKVPGMDCTACHGSGGLNQGRLAFTAFDEEGFMRAGQTLTLDGSAVRINALSINDVERSVIGNPNGNQGERDAYALYLENYASYGFDFETPFEPSETRFFGVNISNFNADPANPNNPSYPKLSEMAQVMAEHPYFEACMAQHMFQFVKFGKPLGISYRPPEYAAQDWAKKFKESNYKLKKLLFEVLTHPSYLNL